MSTSNPCGMFIALEGADRSGKSTQSVLLADGLTKLTGRKTLLLRFPDRSTPVGKTIGEYLSGVRKVDDHAVHLLFTANRWEKQKELRDALTSGACAVADRYMYSGIAYTAAKPPPAPTWEWCCKVEKGVVEPDLVICLTPENAEDLKTRGGYGEERYETDDFQKRVLENYIRLANESKLSNSEEIDPDQIATEWHFVQATNKSVEEVHDCIMSIVKQRLARLSLPKVSDCTD
ncbi:unnamed protein product [Calicophoron daubneyi]